MRDSSVDVVFVDVRELHERLVDSLPGSEHIPLTELIENSVPFGVSSRIVLYCATGVRSLVAAEALRKRGYDHVHNLEGGLSEWRRVFPD